MVPDGQMHGAQLTESEIDRSIGKSDLKMQDKKGSQLLPKMCFINLCTTHDERESISVYVVFLGNRAQVHSTNSKSF